MDSRIQDVTSTRMPHRTNEQGVPVARAVLIHLFEIVRLWFSDFADVYSHEILSPKNPVGE